MIKDYSQYLLFTITNIVVSFLLLYAIATTLDKVAYAEYGYFWTIASMLLLVINLGHKDTLFKYLSKRELEKASNILGSVFTICVCLMTVLIICFVTLDSLLALSVISAIGLHLLNILAVRYRAFEKYVPDAATLILYRLIWLLFLGCTVYLAGNVTTSDVFVSSIMASILMFFLLGGCQLIKQVGLKLEHVKRAIKDSLLRRFFVIELVTVSFMKLDMIILNNIDIEPNNIADYFFALQIFEAAILVMVPVSFMFFNKYNQAGANFLLYKLFAKSFAILLAVYLIGMLTWWLIGGQLLDLIFPKYTNAFELVFILTAALLPNAVNAVLSSFLFANNRESLFIKICVLGVFALIAIDWFFVPALGVSGAAWGRLISEVLISILLIFSAIKIYMAGKHIRPLKG